MQELAYCVAGGSLHGDSAHDLPFITPLSGFCSRINTCSAYSLSTVAARRTLTSRVSPRGQTRVRVSKQRTSPVDQVPRRLHRKEAEHATPNFSGKGLHTARRDSGGSSCEDAASPRNCSRESLALPFS